MRASFEHKVSNNHLNLQLCGKSHSFGHEHKRDNTFSRFSSLSQCIDILSPLSGVTRVVSFHFGVVVEGKLRMSQVWRQHCLDATSPIHGILGFVVFPLWFCCWGSLGAHISYSWHPWKQKIKQQDNNKTNKGLLESFNTIHGILVGQNRIDFF